jgi:hypothetical protein
MASALGTLAFLLAFVPPALAQGAPRKTVRTAGDLPAFSYPAAAGPAALIRSEDAFRPIAQKLRHDLESLLRDYTIEDRATLRRLHSTLLDLAFLDNRTADARREIAIIRSLQDKPAAKLTSGLMDEALLDSGGLSADPVQFLRKYSVALNRLPWDIVGDEIKQTRAGFETLSESLITGLVETRYGPAIT